MGNFKASNGMKVPVDGHPFALVAANGVTTQTFSAGDAQALREFFQHERDEELGRWRWPENPEYVVYASRRRILVLNELTGDALRAHREDGYSDSGHGTIYNAASAYFEAHPEPKPWHEAKPWETWVFTIDGKEQSATLDEDREFRDRSFHTCSWMHVKDDRISAGRRIWPESD